MVLHINIELVSMLFFEVSFVKFNLMLCVILYIFRGITRFFHAETQREDGIPVVIVPFPLDKTVPSCQYYNHQTLSGCPHRYNSGFFCAHFMALCLMLEISLKGPRLLIIAETVRYPRGPGALSGVVTVSAFLLPKYQTIRKKNEKCKNCQRS